MAIRPVPVGLHKPVKHAVALLQISRSLGDQSIPNNTPTFISWDTEHNDPEGVYPSVNWGAPFAFGDFGDNPASDGIWVVTASVAFAASNVGTRRIYFENAVGGGQDPRDSRMGVGTGQTMITHTEVIDLPGSGMATLGLGVRVFQDSGAALNIVGAATLRARLIAWRLAR